MDEQLMTRCCIVGGGPAGMMLGYLLARAGIDTIVLEKWADFFRDFRGDTIHPSTMEILAELNILDDFLKIPHNKTYQLEIEIGQQSVVVADFSKLNVKCPYIAFAPQWDFLNFIAREAKAYSHFHLLMQTEGVDLIKNGDVITGVIAKCGNKTLHINADLVVAADGRHSMVREKSQLPLETLSAPMDVLWFKLSRSATDKKSLGRINQGRVMVMLDRGDYWQCGFIIRKGQYELLKEKGMAAFQQYLLEAFPDLQRIEEITAWDQIKLLTIRVDRLHQWNRQGLLCIGDAAHAMSPIGGVGINLAIQDAVASANYLIPAFQKNEITESTLHAIQKRREWPTRVVQAIQVFIQNRMVEKVLNKNNRYDSLPLFLRLLQYFPLLRRVPAYLVGIGIRPEHVVTKYSKD